MAKDITILVGTIGAACGSATTADAATDAPAAYGET